MVGIKAVAAIILSFAAAAPTMGINAFASRSQEDSAELVTQPSVPPAQEFDVVSIKPSSFPEPLKSMGASLALRAGQHSQHGYFHVPNGTAHRLIRLAYNLNDDQILNEPSWADSQLYDVAGKTANNVGFEQMRPMLQSLLAERFSLKAHKSTEDLPVYQLTPANRGMKISQAKPGTCVDPDSSAAVPSPGARLCGSIGITRMYTTPGVGRIQGFSVTMPMLVDVLSQQLGRTVIDKTGFSGTFDFQLDFLDEDAVPAGSPSSAPQPPLISTALQEQLGLKLKSLRGPVEVLVIDHLERPSAN